MASAFAYRHRVGSRRKRRFRSINMMSRRTIHTLRAQSRHHTADAIRVRGREDSPALFFALPLIQKCWSIPLERSTLQLSATVCKHPASSRFWHCCFGLSNPASAFSNGTNCLSNFWLKPMTTCRFSSDESVRYSGSNLVAQQGLRLIIIKMTVNALFLGVNYSKCIPLSLSKILFY